MALLTKKLKAATLIEALVSMVILMLCFGIASMIFVNVMETGNERQQLRAQLRLDAVARQTKRENKYLDETMEWENFIIQKKVSRYLEQEHLFMLDIKAFDKQEKLIAEYKELILTGP